MGVTLAVLSASRKTPYWNERFIKNVTGCFKSLAWFLRILTGMLHGPKLLLWLRFFMSFSTSVSNKAYFDKILVARQSKEHLPRLTWVWSKLIWEMKNGGFDDESRL